MIIETLKSESRELADRFIGRHNPSLLNEYIQFSVGIWALQLSAGVFVDPAKQLRMSAKLAANNADNDRSEDLANTVLADEELTAEILEMAKRHGLMDEKE